MTAPRKILWACGLLAVVLYLGGDFLLFHGPISRRWQQTPPTALAARVGGQPITHSQLARALAARLWLDGKSTTDLTPTEIKLTTAAVLDELIDHELLRLCLKSTTPPLTVSAQEIDARLLRFTSRFESPAALEKAMISQGIPTTQALRDHLSGQLLQEKLIESRIQPLIQVTDQEARTWFKQNPAALVNPERIAARHIFIPTLDHPAEQAQQTLTTALTSLTAQTQDFATLAKELSEDPATKDRGGALGWMSRDRLPLDFSTAAFALELRRPTLVRSKLGWHLVEVTARHPAEPRSFEQAKPEILAALTTLKRRQAVADFRRSLRQPETVKIEIFR
jgi:PPIC-type PPIASE domain